MEVEDVNYLVRLLYFIERFRDNTVSVNIICSNVFILWVFVPLVVYYNMFSVTLRKRKSENI